LHAKRAVYDANGNVISANGNTYQYDSQNELVGLNGGAVRLVYDGDGNRVEKTVNGVTPRYLVDDLNPTGYAQVVEETVNGAPQRTYTYGLQRISENQIVNNTWTPSFYEYDGMGSVRQLTNASGAVTDTYEYDAFGNLLNKTGTTSNEMLYRGEQRDSDLGLYYLRARWYDPITGRFVSRDPKKGVTTDPKTLHKYLYAEGDPVNGVDPSGRQDVLAVGQLDLGLAIRQTAAVIVTGATVACALTLEGSKALAWFDYGIDLGFGRNPVVERTGLCTVQEKSAESCSAQHPDWPVNYVHYSTTPLIAAHVALALDMGYPDALNYLGPYNPLTRRNRQAACGSSKYGNIGMSCDEYPFASTAQGGAGASTAPVSIGEQRTQAGELSSFYRNLGPGEKFCVEVVP
jgi:RHS repeat-associated protein